MERAVLPPHARRMDLYTRLITEHRRERILVLDYEGTLAPFAVTPDSAAPDPALLGVLERLAARDDTTVHVVSGVHRAALERWLGRLDVTLHAETGAFERPRSTDRWELRAGASDWPLRLGEWLPFVAAQMQGAVDRAPGTFVETKATSVTWHYRLAEPEQALEARALLRCLLQPACARHGLALEDASHALEVRPREVTKRRIVERALARAAPDAFVLAAGDDETDEEMFAALPRGAVSVFAGRGRSMARHRVSGPAELRDTLAELSAEPAARREIPALVRPSQP